MAGLGLQSHVHHWQSVPLRARLGLRAENARIVAIEALRIAVGAHPRARRRPAPLGPPQGGVVMVDEKR